MNDENYYKEYINEYMNKHINKTIKKCRIISIIGIVFILLSSTISVMAVSAYLYNSNEVSYNNNASGISSTNVQGAIDELYGHVTDYTSMDTRVSALEGHFKNSSTIEFDSNWATIGKGDTTNEKGYLLYNGTTNRGQFYYAPSVDRTYLASNSSSGSWGQGKLDIVAKPITLGATTGGAGDINLNGNVKINNKTAATVPTVTNILDVKNIPTTAKSYECDWASYDLLIINATQYTNIMESMTIPVSYFNTTYDGVRPILKNTVHDRIYYVYKNGDSAVYIQAGQSASDIYGIRIYGVKF